MMYLLLIFVWIGCLAQELKINRKYTAIKLWLDTKLRQIRIWLSKPLSQRFLIVRKSRILYAYYTDQRFLAKYSRLIFVWFLSA